MYDRLPSVGNLFYQSRVTIGVLAETPWSAMHKKEAGDPEISRRLQIVIPESRVAAH